MLPFTRDQFLGVFAENNYHAAVWPAQFVAYALGLAMGLLTCPLTLFTRFRSLTPA